MPKRAPSSSAPPESPSTQRAARRVLAVDDDEKILQLYRDLLAAKGFDVTACADPTKAVDLIKRGDWDAALVDIRMRGLEGTELVPLLKKVCPELPVLIVSAYCDESQAGYYHSLGASGFVSKPFNHEVLLDAIQRALQQEERIPLVLTSFSLTDGRDLVYQKLIVAALRRTNWNQVKAAQLLGVSRYWLIRWMKRLGITA